MRVIEIRNLWTPFFRFHDLCVTSVDIFVSDSRVSIFTIFKKVNMDLVLSPVFSLLTVPDLKLKRPSWFRQPTANEMLFLVLVSYFLVSLFKCHLFSSNSM
jgi:hypothetical protein